MAYIIPPSFSFPGQTAPSVLSVSSVSYNRSTKTPLPSSIDIDDCISVSEMMMSVRFLYCELSKNADLSGEFKANLSLLAFITHDYEVSYYNNSPHKYNTHHKEVMEGPQKFLRETYRTMRDANPENVSLPWMKVLGKYLAYTDLVARALVSDPQRDDIIVCYKKGTDKLDLYSKTATALAAASAAPAAAAAQS
jgi:hypothetical protein